MVKQMHKQYTEDQWLAIRTAPEWIGAAVASAGKIGIIGTLKEDAAIRNIMTAKGNAYQHNQIIRPIVAELGERGPKLDLAFREQQWELRKRYKSDGARNSQVLLDFAIEVLLDALTLLAAAADQRDVSEYKRWVLETGQAVAEVAKEGAFLGIGGQRVSQPELEFLERVRTVLRV